MADQAGCDPVADPECGGARDRDHARHRLFRHAIPRAGAGSRRTRTQQQRAAAVAAFRPATERSPARARGRRDRHAGRGGRYVGRVRTANVDAQRARDAAHQAFGAAACRRAEPLECQGMADQFFRDVAGARRQHRGPPLLQGVHVGTADARGDRRAGRQQGNEELDHAVRAQDRRPQRRDHRLCQPRRRTLAFRGLCRIAGARQRYRDLDDSPQRHYHRPLSQGTTA